MNSSNLILGYATNSTAASLRAFVVSARRCHGADCRIALFVTPGGPEAAGIQALAEAHAVELLPATSQWSGDRPRASKIAARGALAWWRRLDRHGGPRGDITRQLALAGWLHPHYSRWFDYGRYLALRPLLHQVFLSDVTDVFFQRNVFDQIADDGLTMPSLPMVYDDRNCDSLWMRGALGEQRLVELRGKPVLCIGTVGGSVEVVSALCRKMWSTFEETPHAGVEQAYFNDLYYRGALGPAVIRSNDDTFVLTITSEAECPKLVAAEGGFRHGAEPPAVVHMYNRLSAGWKPRIDAAIDGRLDVAAVS